MQAIFKFSGWRVKTKLFYFFLLISKEKWNFLLQARAKALLCFSPLLSAKYILDILWNITKNIMDFLGSVAAIISGIYNAQKL